VALLRGGVGFVQSLDPDNAIVITLSYLLLGRGGSAAWCGGCRAEPWSRHHHRLGHSERVPGLFGREVRVMCAIVRMYFNYSHWATWKSGACSLCANVSLDFLWGCLEERYVKFVRCVQTTFNLFPGLTSPPSFNNLQGYLLERYVYNLCKHTFVFILGYLVEICRGG